MTFAIILAVITCVVAGVITFSLTRVEDKNYSSEASFANLTSIYLIWLPAALVIFGVIALIWYFL